MVDLYFGSEMKGGVGNENWAPRSLRQRVLYNSLKKKKKKANPCTVFSVAKCTDLIQVCTQVPMVCCALEISVANRVNGLLN